MDDNLNPLVIPLSAKPGLFEPISSAGLPDPQPKNAPKAEPTVVRKPTESMLNTWQRTAAIRKTESGLASSPTERLTVGKGLAEPLPQSVLKKPNRPLSTLPNTPIKRPQPVSLANAVQSPKQPLRTATSSTSPTPSNKSVSSVIVEPLVRKNNLGSALPTTPTQAKNATLSLVQENVATSRQYPSSSLLPSGTSSRRSISALPTASIAPRSGGGFTSSLPMVGEDSMRDIARDIRDLLTVVASQANSDDGGPPPPPYSQDAFSHRSDSHVRGGAGVSGNWLD